MFKRTTQQVQALESVMRAPGGQLFWEMLLAMVAEKDRESRKLDGPVMYRAQGAADALEQLANDMEATLRKRPELPQYRPPTDRPLKAGSYT